jgi:hypothetical protein
MRNLDATTTGKTNGRATGTAAAHGGGADTRRGSDHTNTQGDLRRRLPSLLCAAFCFTRRPLRETSKNARKNRGGARFHFYFPRFCVICMKLVSKYPEHFLYGLFSTAYRPPLPLVLGTGKCEKSE